MCIKISDTPVDYWVNLCAVCLRRVIVREVLHKSRRKSSKKNQSKGQLKHLRNELYRKRDAKIVSWKTFSNKKDSQREPDKCKNLHRSNICRADAELTKLGRLINQTRRQVFGATESRAIGKKAKSVLFKKQYDEFDVGLKSLICS
ncbi:unnamed protein product [Trichobilharzia szidati]|nr:unnamed protein product [Trichobilharzia szidati]